MATRTSRVPGDSTIHRTTLSSPVGTLNLAASNRGLTGVSILAESGPAKAPPEVDVLREAAEQLERYFRGELREFRVQLDLRGTPFQILVWNALREIPFGATCSYAQLAERIDRPRSVRAVGTANARNPVAIIVPCHRVIGSDGSLTGYAAGLGVKHALLDHEARMAGRSPEPRQLKLADLINT